MVDATQRDVTHDLSAYERDGYVVLEHAVDGDTLERIRTELSPGSATTRSRAQRLRGLRPNRVYALLAKAPSIAALVEHPWVLAMLDQLLPPNYLLSANLAINLLPGETAQQFHIDDDFYQAPSAAPGDQRQRDLGDRRVHGRERRHRSHPRQSPLGRRVPRPTTPTSPGRDARRIRRRVRRHVVAPRWRQPQRPTPPGHHAAVLRTVGPPAGAADPVRRTAAAEYSERIQSLLGYSIHPPFMGHVDGLHPLRLLDPHTTAPRRAPASRCRLLDRGRRAGKVNGISAARMPHDMGNDEASWSGSSSPVLRCRPCRPTMTVGVRDAAG